MEPSPGASEGWKRSMSTQSPETAGSPEIAFYYPGTIWYTSDWIKSLLLFFDGVALLVPAYMKDRPEQIDPIMASPLRDQGLLHILEPETLVDKSATEQLVSALTDIITSGSLDHLSREGTAFHELSFSRLGSHGDFGLAQMILDELKARGLARESKDGVSIPMHPAVRYMILVLLSQILRPKGTALGLDLSPATDRPQLIGALTELLSLPNIPSAGHVVSLDLTTVGVDLSAVPIDEVLGFRAEHLDSHRRYARAVRRFVRELSLLPPGERDRALDEREAELAELAAQLRKTARRFWKRPASFALSVAGAAWRIVAGDPVGAALGVGAAILGMKGEKAETGAYSYLFSARERYV
jgi:hypothetical protein